MAGVERPGALAFAESPAQLLNAIEWAYAENARADTRLVVLGPGDPTTRFQLHRLAELAQADGFAIGWAEVRRRSTAASALARLTRQVHNAGAIVIGDPYSGVIQLLLGAVRSATRLVVVDDGTATLRYAEQWASGERLKRWHLDRQGLPGRITGFRAAGLLGRRSDRVELFTAMPVEVRMPLQVNTYAWVRHRFAVPAVLPGTDLMGSSLVETGVVDEGAYLAGVARLVTERRVARYLPHRHETPAKLAAIERLGVLIVRPDLPMEAYARRGPIGQSILSFPSTVLHTLPLVLAGTPVAIEALSVDDDWFVTGARAEERAFVHGIRSGTPA